MKRILMALAALALVLTVASCGDSSVQQRAMEPSPQDKYVSDLRDTGLSDLRTASAPALISLGESACTLLGRSGPAETLRTMSDIGANYGVAPYTVGNIIGAAAVRLCPEHLDELTYFIGSQSISNT